MGTDSHIVLRYALIYNPQAGTGSRRDYVRAAAEHLRKAGHDAREFAGEESPDQLAEKAVAEGFDVLVACGGDGTVNGVARVAHEHGSILGVLPLGTLNHFARDLGITNAALGEQVLASGMERRIDAGLVNGHLFVNNSGIGIYPTMVLEREKVRKAGLPKWPAFVVACVKTLVKMPFRRLSLEADNVRLRRSTPFLFVGNNVYTLEGMSLGHRNAMDGGCLGVCTARHIGFAGLLRIGLRALFGTLRQDRDFTALTARNLVVRRKRKGSVHVSLDGEVRRLGMPLEYSSLPGALRVLAPPARKR